jgi:alkaline phosphatase
MLRVLMRVLLLAGAATSPRRAAEAAALVHLEPEVGGGGGSAADAGGGGVLTALTGLLCAELACLRRLLACSPEDAAVLLHCACRRIVDTARSEPGTGVFLASSERRKDYTGIARTIVESGADVILAGGEIYLLPAGVLGRHGAPGVRDDGRDLIAAARAAGYTVVYNRYELLAAAGNPTVKRLLGVFAATDTYNDAAEETLAAAGRPLYKLGTPDVADMTAAALQVLERIGQRFLLVVEEEGTDNFANKHNAAGTLEALQRADAAIGVARRYLATHPGTLVLTAADSDAGGMQLIPFGKQCDPAEPAPVLPAATAIGNPVDGVAGTGTAAFLSAPDRAGVRFWFGVAWGGPDDMIGGIVARAAGLNAERLRVNLDNTQLYDLMWETLFGRELPE